jgi:hypothetical protein
VLTNREKWDLLQKAATLDFYVNYDLRKDGDPFGPFNKLSVPGLPYSETALGWGWRTIQLSTPNGDVNVPDQDIHFVEITWDTLDYTIKNAEDGVAIIHQNIRVINSTQQWRDNVAEQEKRQREYGEYLNKRVAELPDSGVLLVEFEDDPDDEGSVTGWSLMDASDFKASILAIRDNPFKSRLYFGGQGDSKTYESLEDVLGVLEWKPVDPEDAEAVKRVIGSSSGYSWEGILEADEDEEDED